MRTSLDTFAHSLLAARRARGLNQREFAKRLGVPVLVLSKLERAELAPDSAILTSLSREFSLVLTAAGEVATAGSGDLPAVAAAAESQSGLFATALAETRISAFSPQREHQDLETIQSANVLAPVDAQYGSAAIPVTVRPMLGTTVRGYQLLEKIGEGGFGAVYRARQLSVMRDVAIKVVKPELADDVDFVRRFEIEAALVARLEHANIVPLYDFWREPGAAYMVMRLLKGGSLAQLLKAPPRESAQREVLPILHQVAQALQIAHAAGVVHRDLKPANILLDEAGNAALADFGVAKQLAGDSSAGDSTGAGEVVGSIAYCAPEQLRAETVSPATDVYALALVAFELITGRRPFAATTAATMINHHLNVIPPALSEFIDGLPSGVDAVLKRALAKNAADRHQDSISFVLDLEAAFRSMESSDGRYVSSWLGAARAPSADSALLSTALQYADLDNPYVGLASFDECDAPNFFGREALVEQLLEKLGENCALSRALVVIGASGSGKSSAVRAGLIPALRAGALSGSADFVISTMMPGADPFAALASALKRVFVREFDVLAMLKADAFGLARVIDRGLPNVQGCELVLVVDQFEELFTLCANDSVRRAWIAAISTALMETHSRLRIIFTLRADFLDRPLQYPDLSEIVRARAVLVPSMSLDELERAIVGPARRIGLAFEEGLVAAILEEVRDELGALPLLQYALAELFVRRDRRELTLAAFRAIGGVRGALAGRAESAYLDLAPDAQIAARQLFMRLTTLGEGREDTRRRAARSEIDALHRLGFDRTSHAADSHKAASQAALDAFAKARLLTFDRDAVTFSATVEVAHEALLRNWKRLRDWLSASRAELRLQRQLSESAALWRSNAQDTSFLLSGNRLAQFRHLKHQQDVFLTNDESSFLDHALAAHDAHEQAESARQQRELSTAQALAREQLAATELAQTAVQIQRRSNANLRWLVAGLGVILAFALWQSYALKARSTALALETTRANVEAKSAGALSDFWQELFATADPNRAKGQALKVRDVLDVGVAQLSSKLNDAPVARARLLLTIARTYRQLGVLEAARSAIAQAEIAVKALKEPSAQTEIALESARIFADSRQPDAAIARLEWASQLQTEANASPLARAVTLNIWATVLNDKNQLNDAIKMLREVLALRTQHGAPETELASTMNNLAFSLNKTARLKEARTLFEQSYLLRKKQLGPHHLDTAFNGENLANAERDLGNFSRADALYEEVFEALAVLFPDPAAPHTVMFNVLLDQAASFRLQNRWPEAMAKLDAALALLKKPGIATNGLTLVLEQSEALTALRRFPEAQLALERCRELVKRSYGTEHITSARCDWRQVQLTFAQSGRVDQSLLASVLGRFATSPDQTRLDHALALAFAVQRGADPVLRARLEAVLRIYQDYPQAQSLLKSLKN